jgi:hypothetical protein
VLNGSFSPVSKRTTYAESITLFNWPLLIGSIFDISSVVNS